MSDVVSFGNIVNSLRSVRDDYNEHLKSVPQYAAFLLVESSTQSVADALQGTADAQSTAAEVVEALETAKTKFRQHLGNIREYRALLAIDKLIREVCADLEVGIETQTRPIIEQQPVEISQDASAASPSDQITENQIAVPEAAAVVDSQPEAAAPPAEIIEQTPIVSAAGVQTDTQAELTSADVSQVQVARQQPLEEPAEAAHASAVEETVGAPIDMTLPAAEAVPTSVNPPTPLETEKAA